MLRVELECLAEVAQRELGVAHHVEALAALVQLGQAVVGVEGLRLHLTHRAHLGLPLLPQVCILLAALGLARERLVPAVGLSRADAALTLAVAGPAALDDLVASAVHARLPLAVGRAVLGLPP